MDAIHVIMKIEFCGIVPSAYLKSFTFEQVVWSKKSLHEWPVGISKWGANALEMQMQMFSHPFSSEIGDGTIKIQAIFFESSLKTRHLKPKPNMYSKQA